MSAAKREYERFLVWLSQRDPSMEVRRFAHSVYSNFDALAETTSYQSQRSRTLAPFVLAAWEQVEPPTDIAIPNRTLDVPWRRLQRLEVGPFRGFQRAEEFALDRRVVLFYGPNGTGKSSLCEALEFCLLGGVEEAAHKRIPHADYYENVHTGSHVPPRLWVLSAAAEVGEVEANADFYRFCFVDRNRIDAFARMASRTTQQRLALIATLFGLDQFNDFVRGFNNDMDGQFSLPEVLSQDLAIRRAALAQDEATIAGENNRAITLNTQAERIAAEHEPPLTYEELLRRIGSPEADGRLQEIDALLAEELPADRSVDASSLDRLIAAVDNGAAGVETLSVRLADRQSDVNYRALYQAVLGLQHEVAERCPACDTPLAGENAAHSDPYDKAQEGLRRLADLAQLQQELEEARAALADNTRLLGEKCHVVIAYARSVDPEHPLLNAFDGLGANPVVDWPHYLRQAANEAGATPLRWCAELAQRADTEDRALAQRREERGRLADERQRLDAARLRVIQVQTEQRILWESVAAARERVGAFETANADLIQRVAVEGQTAAKHRLMRQAYGSYLGALRQYRDELPATLTANLAQTALNLYNGFNRRDTEGDMLTELRLPVGEADRIMVAFRSHPNTLVDALQVMSEGHTRCLGVAILLAKNVELNCPVVIFDDAVNAIDNEHRLGIRDTLFDNELFAEKQMLLTCHGEELVKDIQVLMGHLNARDDCLTYTFLPHEGDKIIRVEASTPLNYLVDARLNLDTGRVRDAVASARRAMEAVNDKTWRFLGKLGLGELELKFARARAPLDQNNLASKLKSALSRPAFVHEQKDALVGGYTTMLQANNWALFNVGTHENEGQEDFDRGHVNTVITNLELLDAALSAPVALIVPQQAAAR